jgi:choice-of-anchor A domain-containing protein
LGARILHFKEVLMFDSQRNGNLPYAGIPYEDINWYDIAGQPFGIASNFNAIVFGDANNIVDTKGAFTVGRDFISPRGLTLAYGNDGNLTGTGYSPDLVRFLVGRNIAMQGPLVVVGHVVAGGNFRAAEGSTYLIGKDGTDDQIQELKVLYQAQGGSQYWIPGDRGSHYIISSYDVPRFIPASRIGADVSEFFDDARESIEFYHECITNLNANGTVTDHFHEKILRGNDPVQNVFVIDARPNGILDKEFRFEIPNGSIAIVIFRTGNNAHIQYGLWGSENLANRTLYVFEDAANIYMEVPAAIWGSILAPNAMFHGHQTGGHASDTDTGACTRTDSNPCSGTDTSSRRTASCRVSSLSTA